MSGAVPVPEDWGNREAVEAWLRRQPREVSVALAARAALRVLPLVVRALNMEAAEGGVAIVLPTFRAAAVAVVAGSTDGAEVDVVAHAAVRAARVAARSATSAADRAAARVAARSATSAAARAAARAAVDADLAAVNAAIAAARAAVDAAVDAAIAVAVRSTVDAAFAAARAARAAVDAGAARAAFATDAEHVLRGGDAFTLTSAPLWPDGRPDWAAAAWSALRTQMLAADEGWEVWTAWYEARLKGGPVDVKLETRRVIEPRLWDEGPAAVNAEIAEIIEDHEAKQRSASLPRRLDQALDSDPLRAALADFTYAEAVRRMALVPFADDWADGGPGKVRELDDLARTAQHLAEDIEDERINDRVAQRMVRDARRYLSEARRGPAYASLSFLWDSARYIYSARLEPETAIVIPKALLDRVDGFVDNHLAFFRRHAAPALQRANGLAQVQPTPSASIPDVFAALRAARDAMRQGNWKEGTQLDERGLIVIDSLIDELEDLRDELASRSDQRLERHFWTKSAQTATTIVRYGYRAASYGAAGANLLAAAKTLWPETFGAALDLILGYFPAIPDVDSDDFGIDA